MINYPKKTRDFIFALFIPLLVISIVLFTTNHKELFVHESGNIRILGGPIILLAISLLFKWKMARLILKVVVTISIIGVLIFVIISNNDFLLSYTGLLLALLIIEYLLFCSKSVSEYLDGTKKY